MDEKTILYHIQAQLSLEIRYLWKDAPSEVSIYNELEIPLPPFRKTIGN